tara:strand:+ start:381 stop:671 length:291 start_codon:yes stop_codon:yes gene_type:complete
MFSYNVSFGSGIKIKVNANDKSSEGSIQMLGQISDVEQARKFLAGEGVAPEKDSAQKVENALDSWKFEWKVEGGFQRPPMPPPPPHQAPSSEEEEE